ncbi:hypothetical protein MARA_29620 [Mycolicibacterium arabiense]|uniref:Uncharacterized protein n=1 Tax=Mycolicibacterium arabiense TaxID=1286181 RepID=A0A7I7RXZ0_9MYCO|nr:hypothetical protein MARA_29620 [Mycolicibacterium arabiense]
MWRHPLEVAPGPAADVPGRQRVARGVQVRHRRRVDDRRDAAGPRQLIEVPEQPVAVEVIAICNAVRLDSLYVELEKLTKIGRVCRWVTPVFWWFDSRGYAGVLG